MKKFLALILIILPLSAFAQEMFFRIAVSDKKYTSFVSDKLKQQDAKLHMLVMKLQEPLFDVNCINLEYYDINVTQGMKYYDKNVSQYEINPKTSDRFRHVILVDAEGKFAVRREVYSTNGKLMYAYGHINWVPGKKVRNAGREQRVFRGEETFDGFRILHHLIRKDNHLHQALFSDGLNRFSVFWKKDVPNTEHSEKLINGNYVLRTNINGNFFAVVGTVPFEQMRKAAEYIYRQEVESK